MAASTSPTPAALSSGARRRATGLVRWLMRDAGRGDMTPGVVSFALVSHPGKICFVAVGVYSTRTEHRCSKRASSSIDPRPLPLMVSATLPPSDMPATLYKQPLVPPPSPLVTHPAPRRRRPP
ncbi:hypothetical protein BC629DRAFT_1175215 [Irpex lacteus]|nr:hypothetical protein BC629DRAFT_1175215 [Irpex lacteus]